MSEVSISWDESAKHTLIIRAQNHTTWQALALAVLVICVCSMITEVPMVRRVTPGAESH